MKRLFQTIVLFETLISLGIAKSLIRRGIENMTGWLLIVGITGVSLICFFLIGKMADDKKA